MNKKIALLYGGPSVEREISLMTQKNVSKTLKELALDFSLIEAHWDSLKKLKEIRPSKAFLAVHGPFGEDGRLQGFLEFLKIPYTGSGVLASAFCMDKIFFKKRMKENSIVIPPYQVWKKESDIDLFPCVVKPNASGSSLGISICKKKEELKKALDEALKIDSRILIEEYIEGKEIAVSWLNGKVLTPVEIETPSRHFYDFKRKYEKGETQYILPPTINSQTMDKIKKIMKQAVKISQIRSYCRGDFIVDKKNNIYLLELNTLPGLTELSLLPMSAKHDGISYKELIVKILEGAALDQPKIKP